MNTGETIQRFIPTMDSAQRVYQLFAHLNYPEKNILDPSYRRDISEFDFAKEEEEKIKEIYTALNFDGKLPVFLIEQRPYLHLSSDTLPNTLPSDTRGFLSSLLKIIWNTPLSFQSMSG